MLHFVLYGHLRRLRDAVLVAAACLACGGILLAIAIAAGPATPAGTASAGQRPHSGGPPRDDGAWRPAPPGSPAGNQTVR